MGTRSEFVFRRHDQIGALDARQDEAFLSQCFVDTGDLSVLLDCSDPRRVVVGRTGAGKTALLQRLAELAGRATLLPPEHLALNYVSNSTILSFVFGLGVKLDPFFRLLWRHVLVVELIKLHAALSNERDQSGWLTRLRSKFSGQPLREQKLERRMNYLHKFGGEFWQDTEKRIHEVTSTVEKDVKGAITIPLGGLLAVNADGAKHLSVEEKADIIVRAQSVVNQIQVRELTEILELVDSIFDDAQQRYYVVIDRLDEDWVDDRFRYALIRALIETVREFHKVRHAKIVVGIRLDLLDRVFANTIDGGFQREKYETELLRLQWRKEDLVEVLDRRIGQMVKRRYTGATVSHGDVLPRKIGGQAVTDFIVQRTLMRPRDVIHFFNECIMQSDGRAKVSERALLAAEGEYSRGRLQSLYDEWRPEFPNLPLVVDLVKGRPSVFEVGSVSSDEVGELCLQSLISGRMAAPDRISRGAEDVVERRMLPDEFWLEVVELLYRIGLLGLKTDPAHPTMWSVDGRRSVSTSEITRSTKLQVHRCYSRALGTRGGNTAQPTSDA